MLDREFNFYLKHQDNLLKDYRGKYLVIKGDEIIGVFDNFDSALLTSMKDHALGTFLIQLCEPGDSSYTQSFHSRVAFL